MSFAMDFIWFYVLVLVFFAYFRDHPPLSFRGKLFSLILFIFIFLKAPEYFWEILMGEHWLLLGFCVLIMLMYMLSS
jgi:hypothetical protein